MLTLSLFLLPCLALVTGRAHSNAKLDRMTPAPTQALQSL